MRISDWSSDVCSSDLGHRAPKAPFAAGAGTDLNAIPLAAVERIEILTDGASAIYGADAVGGVINLILRKDYNGAQVTVGKSSPKWGPTDEASNLDRKSVGEGKRVSVRVDLGVRPYIK